MHFRVCPNFAHFAHINFRGTMRFGVDKYADALVQHRPVSAGLCRNSEHEVECTEAADNQKARE